jgi:hypothetical protein
MPTPRPSTSASPSTSTASSTTQLRVHNNGLVSLGGTDFGDLGKHGDFLISLQVPAIAAFWADVDTTTAGSPVVYGAGTVGGRPSFGVGWLNVVDCYEGDATRTNRNHFQLVFIDRSDLAEGAFDLELNYDQVQWDIGEASGGNQDCVQGDGPISGPRVGFTSGNNSPGLVADGTQAEATSGAFELPGTGFAGAFLDSNATSGLIHNSLSSTQKGRYRFEFREGGPFNGTARIFGRIVDETGAPASAIVQACLVELSLCGTGETNSNGDYEIFGLIAGTYELTIYPFGAESVPAPEEWDGELLDGESRELNAQVVGPALPPEGTDFTPSKPGPGGVPIVPWDKPILIEVVAPALCEVSWHVKLGLREVSGPMELVGVSGLIGSFAGHIPVLEPMHGLAEFSIVYDCPGGLDVDVFNLYIDPSGVVKDQHGNLIEGATVTLVRSDSGLPGEFTQVPDQSAIMSPSNRANPDLTDEDGRFGWDVIAGFYVVQAQAQGCHAPGDDSQAWVETEVLTIPPPRLDLELVLECPGAEPPESTLEVRKTLFPAADPGRFNLAIDGTTEAADTADGGTTGAVPVSADEHTISETAGTATSLAAYAAWARCLDSGGSEVAEGPLPLTVDVQPGEDVVCVIDNTRLPAECHGMTFSGPAIIGTAGSETLTGTSGADLILALAGHDRIPAGEGDDCISAGDGFDRVDGQGGHDRILGEGSIDIIDAGPGDDLADGGPGIDLVWGGAGNDTLRGGGGFFNLLFGGPGTDTCSGGFPLGCEP